MDFDDIFSDKNLSNNSMNQSDKKNLLLSNEDQNKSNLENSKEIANLVDR